MGSRVATDALLMGITVEKFWADLFKADGPFGLDPGFAQNLTSEFAGFLLSLVVFSIMIPLVIDWRQNRKWRPARRNFGQELLTLHVAFGEAVLRFVRTPVAEHEARGRAADGVDKAYRNFAALNGLYGYALNADISREANDYMREARAIRDWSYEAAHPEDRGFAQVERRVKRTRQMFAQVNKELKDVLDELGVSGFEEAHWPAHDIKEMEEAFEGKHSHAHGHAIHHGGVHAQAATAAAALKGRR